jgi:hypothetical protein
METLLTRFGDTCVVVCGVKTMCLDLKVWLSIAAVIPEPVATAHVARAGADSGS